MRLGDTHVPIPHTIVKTQAADGTMPGTAWESRWLPEQRKQQPEGVQIELVSTSDQRAGEPAF